MLVRALRVNKLPLSLCLLLLLLQTACRRNSADVRHATTSPLEQALHANADAGHLASLHWPDFSDYKPLVEAFYTQRNWNPAWVDGKSATRQALALTKLFAESASKGLNPDDYDAPLWTGRLASLGSATDAQRAEFDTAMTVATMRYISDLHIGRVNPQHFAFGVSVETKKYDLPNFVAQQVVGAGDVGDALKGVEPDSTAYRDTEQALVHYQVLAKQAGTMETLPVPAQPLSAGASYAGAAALAARLQLLGDMSAANGEGNTYSQTLSDGIRSFQTTHDLPVDGRLTPQTAAALNVPLDARVRQIEDTLERMRWLAPEYQNPGVLVNIPEFVLRTYADGNKEQFQMRVVVGQSLEEDHKTPVLVQEMKYIVLRPYWNVTPTIVKKELLPHIETNKGYLASKNFEVVDRSGKPTDGWTADALAHGQYMVREKPGPKNSLGLVKFMFPNKLNIYLHSTPATELFDHSRRDFSHGCIRLQEPEKLADWVLRDQPDWAPDKIHDAMENGEDNKNVSLSHPIPVLIFYETARVDQDGKVHFFDDIYGYDKDMEAVLAHGDPFPVQPEPKEQPSDTE